MEEVWKDVKGYEGIYQVSNLGRVKSLARVTRNQYTHKERILKGQVGNCGYKMVTTRVDGIQHAFLVHRLVAEAFIPNPNNYRCVNHKDENKLNNCVDNLEWCTHKYNNNYGSHSKKSSQTQLNKVHFGKEVICVETQKRYKNSYEVQRKLGFLAGHIRECCRGIYKKAYGFTWKYAA